MNPQEINYSLLKILNLDADLTQRAMAKKMGISLGKVNYCISELVKKGFIKIQRFNESKTKFRYLYILTPKGICIHAVPLSRIKTFAMAISTKVPFLKSGKGLRGSRF